MGRRKIAIVALGYVGKWHWFRDVKGATWAVHATHLGSPSSIIGMARGNDAFLQAAYPLRSSAGTVMGWSAVAWHGRLLADSEDAGRLSADKVPQARFISAAGASGPIELPPMPACGRAVPSAGHLAVSSLDLAPPEPGSASRIAA